MWKRLGRRLSVCVVCVDSVYDILIDYVSICRKLITHEFDVLCFYADVSKSGCIGFVIVSISLYMVSQRGFVILLWDLAHSIIYSICV